MLNQELQSSLNDAFTYAHELSLKSEVTNKNLQF